MSAALPTGRSARTAQVALVVLGVTLTVHTLAFTPLSHSLDDIKQVTLWIGGALCLGTWVLLLARGGVRLPQPLVLAGLGTFGTACALSVLFAAPHARWAGWDALLGLAALTGVFLLAAASVGSLAAARAGLRLWIGVGLATCAFGIFHHSGGFALLDGWMTERAMRNEGARAGILFMVVRTFASTSEMISTLLNPQFFGNYLGMLLPLAAVELVLSRREAPRSPHALWWSRAAALLLVLATWCILQTNSKSSIAMIPLTLVALPFAMRWASGDALPGFAHPRRWAAGAVGLLLVAAFLLRGQLGRLADTMETSLGSRGVIWSGAWRLFVESPLLGHGPGSFRIAFPGVRSPDYHLHAVSNLTLYAHNIVFDLLAEVGLVGALAFAFFLGALLWFGIRAARRLESPEERLICAALLLGVLMLLAGAMLTPMVRWPAGALIAFALLGQLAGLSVPNRGKEAAAPPAVRGIVVPLAAAAVVLLALTGTRAQAFFSASMDNARGLEAVREARFVETARGGGYRAAAEELDRAVASFERALERDPRFLTSYYQLAHAQNRRGMMTRELQRDAASDSLDAYLDAMAQTRAWQERALETYARLRAFAPDYSEVHYNIGVLHMGMGLDGLLASTHAAEAQPERAAELRSEAVRSLEDAVEAFERAAAMSNKITVHALHGATLRRLAQELPEGSEERRATLLRAGEILERAHALPPSYYAPSEDQRRQEEQDRREALVAAARALTEAREWERAAELWERAARDRPARTDHWHEAARAWRRAGNRPASEGVLEKALARNRLNGELLLVRAQWLVEDAPEIVSRSEAAAAVYELRHLAENVPGLLSDNQSARLQRLLRTISTWPRIDAETAPR